MSSNFNFTDSYQQRRIARVCGSLITAVGLAVIVGWQFHITLLKSLSTDYISMKFNTTFALISYAVALIIYSRTHVTRRMRIAALALTTLGILISAATLSEYLVGWNLHIDELFYTDMPDALGLHPPGRMAPVTAICFILLGTGTWLSQNGRRVYYQTAQLLFFVTLLICFRAILGYMLGVQSSFGIALQSRIAIHTSLSFIFLSFGYLCLCTKQGYMKIIFARTEGGATARKLMSVAILLPSVFHFLNSLALKAALYDADFGTLLQLSCSTTLLVIIIWRNSENLHRTEIEREHAQQETVHLLAEREVVHATQKSEGRLRAIFESAFDAIIGTTSEGTICDWNPQAEKIFGWSKTEAIGHKMSDLIMPPNLRGEYEKKLSDFIRIGEGPIFSRAVEVQALRKTGELFPIRLAISPVKFGQDYLFSAFIADISDHKKNEQELIETRQKALAATHAKSEFLANMSHEIRTPLNSIIGMADLVSETPLNPQQKKYIKIVQDSGTALLSVINDILDFSKIEAGKMDLELVDFDLLALVEGQAELLAVRAKEKNITLMTYIDPQIPDFVKGDSGRIGQILLNLLGNALKFTETGSVTVRVAATAVEPSGIHLKFSVQDTGVGLSKNDMSRLFRPFTQADGSTARRFGGTGLGLSICKRLVELMKGQIGVESVEGEGSVFWFTCELGYPEKHPTASETPRRDITPQPKLMVVDDDEASREIIQQYLKNWNFDVTVCAQPKEALRLLRTAASKNSPFEIALIDKRMPIMDGFVLAREIQADPFLSWTKVILITAYDRDTQLEGALRAGFSAYLTKPIRQSELYNSIVDLLQVLRKGPKEFQDQVAEINSIPLPTHTPQERHLRVLVAEDNAVNQLLTLTQLKKLGYMAQAVADGQEAINAYIQGSCDLILMDCQMPNMDGFEATRRIRAIEKETGVHIPIIALTANAMKEDKDNCLAAGMDDYIAKPVKKEKLAEVLLRWLPEKQKTA